MATIPTTPTFTAGSIALSEQFNAVAAVIDFWANRPSAYVYRTAADVYSNNTWLAQPWSASELDVVPEGDLLHWPLGSSTRLHIRTTGKYSINGQIQFATNSTGARGMQIRLNAGGNVAAGTLLVVSYQSPLTGASTSVGTAPVEAQLNEGDYLELFGLQSSGGDLAIVGGRGVTFLRASLTGA